MPMAILEMLLALLDLKVDAVEWIVRFSQTMSSLYNPYTKTVGAIRTTCSVPGNLANEANA